MKQQRDLAALIDPTLTIDTARERGVAWVCDLFAEMLAQQQPLLADLLHEGFQLGKPLPQSRYETIGLYRPQQHALPAEGADRAKNRAHTQQIRPTKGTSKTVTKPRSSRHWKWMRRTDDLTNSDRVRILAPRLYAPVYHRPHLYSPSR